MNFTLRQLQLFAALPDFPTLAAAASSLHISESALSHAVSELERNVGEQLCIRRKARGFSLTPAGQLFAERARELLREAEELGHALSSQRGKLRGPVALGCFTGLAATVLPPLLEGFPRQHPEVSIGITVGGHDDLLAALHAGRLDAAVLYDTLLPPGLEHYTIYDTEVVAVLPEGHRLSAEESVDLADLVEEPLIMLDSTPSAAHTHQLFRDRGLTPRVLTAVPVIDLVRALVGRGLGYSLLMSRPNALGITAEGRKIVARPLRPRTGVTTTVAVWSAEATLTARAHAVVEYTATQLRHEAEHFRTASR